MRGEVEGTTSALTPSCHLLRVDFCPCLQGEGQWGRVPESHQILSVQFQNLGSPIRPFIATSSTTPMHMPFVLHGTLNGFDCPVLADTKHTLIMTHSYIVFFPFVEDQEHTTPKSQTHAQYLLPSWKATEQSFEMLTTSWSILQNKTGRAKCDSKPSCSHQRSSLSNTQKHLGASAALLLAICRDEKTCKGQIYHYWLLPKKKKPQ